MNDDELRSVLTAVDDRPRDEFRNELRALLASDPGESRTRATSRMPLLAVAAGFVVLVGGLVLIDRARDDSTAPATVPGTPPVSTAPTSSTGPNQVPGNELAASIAGHTWVSADPYEFGLPQFTVSGDAGQLDVVGDAGCNDFSGPFQLSPAGAVVNSSIETTTADCGEPPGSSLSALVTSITLVDKILTVSTDAGGMRYVTFDGMAPIPSVEGLPGGTWVSAGNDGDETVVFGDGTVTIGTCVLGFEFRQDLMFATTYDPDCHPSAGVLQAMTSALKSVVGVELRADAQLFVHIPGPTSSNAGDLIFRLEQQPLDPDGIVFAEGAAFGYQAGTDVSVAAVVEHLTALLGAPDHDTGWYVDADDTSADLPDCTAGLTIRVMWWKDFSVAFRHSPDAQDDDGAMLSSWAVGERAVAGPNGRYDDYTPPDGSVSAIQTDTGIGIGTTEQRLMTQYGTTGHRYAEDETGLAMWELNNESNHPLASARRFGLRAGAVSGYSATTEVC